MWRGSVWIEFTDTTTAASFPSMHSASVLVSFSEPLRQAVVFASAASPFTSPDHISMLTVGHCFLETINAAQQLTMEEKTPVFVVASASLVPAVAIVAAAVAAAGVIVVVVVVAVAFVVAAAAVVAVDWC